VRRAGGDVDIKVTLASPRPLGPDRSRQRSQTRFSREVYRLAVVPIEFPDVSTTPNQEHPIGKIRSTPRELTPASERDGTPVYGSLNDYYQEHRAGSCALRASSSNGASR